MDAVQRWLHTQRSRLLEALDDGPAGVRDHAGAVLEPVLDGVEALAAAGAISREEAAKWRAGLEADATRGRRSAAAPDPRAEAVLAELLDALAPDPEDDEAGLDRFEGALRLLSAAGLADAGEWDARLRERAGWPTAAQELAEERDRGAGGTQVDLVSVHAGPPEGRGGRRLAVLLRFADAVEVLLDKAPGAGWSEWELRDSSGTAFGPRGAGGGDESESVSFAGAIAPDAEWVELTQADRPDVAFRVPL